MRVLTALLFFVLLSACGPIIMIPGGAIEGTSRAVPDNWSFTDDVEVVVLETRPSDPYSVNVWAVAAGEHLYIAAAGSTWADYIQDDGRVRLQVDEQVFDLKATATDDEAELALFLAAAKKKYDFEPDADQRTSAVLFRLEGR